MRRAVVILVVTLAWPTLLPQSAGATEDVTGPVFVSVSYSQTTVDTSAGPVVLTLTAHITDDVSGLFRGDFGLVSPPKPDGSVTVRNGTFAAWTLVSGTLQDGIFAADVTIPQYAKSGTWRFAYLNMVDQAGNGTTLSAEQLATLPTFEVIGTEDVTGPVFVSVSYSQTTVDTSAGPVVLTLTAHITDDVSGLFRGDFGLVSPPKPDGSVTVRNGTFAAWTLVSGTLQDGIFAADVTIPQYAKSGTWRFAYLNMVDQAGNGTTLSAEQLATLPTFEVSADASAPTITITAPADGASYVLGATVAADYACEDEPGGSGVTSCVGTVADGAAIDTATVGPKTFTVDTHDAAGNSRSLTSNYTVVYSFGGFTPPVDSLPTFNRMKAGGAVAVRFSLGGYQGLGIFATGYPKSQSIACDSTAPVDGIEQTVTAGSSGLSYDAVTDEYVYVWKTDKAWAGTCRQLVVKFIDGMSYRANFNFN